jgi:hypothetical protein
MFYNLICNTMKRILMKSNTMFLLVLFAMLTSCISSQSFLPVKGSGMSVDKNFNVSDFHRIEVSGGFDVLLEQSDSESLILTAQENLFEYITVRVDQGILKVYTENNIMATKPMKVKIFYKSIDNLDVSGGGDVIGETPVNVPELNVEISGGGDFSVMVNTGKLDCRMSGGGDAEINGKISHYNITMSGGGDIHSDTEAEVVSCIISGGGDLTFRSSGKISEALIDMNGGGDVEAELTAEKMRCSVSGGGNATFSGEAAMFEINVNGGGDVNALNLDASTATFRVSGGSDVRVNVSKELTGQITGGGDVYYSGNPEIVTIDAKGGSEIHKQ